MTHTRLSKPFVLLGVLLLGVLLLGLGCARKPVAVDAGVGQVTITIHKNDQARVINVENIATGTTLEHVMRSIDEVPIEISGSGLTAFVNEIDGLATGPSDGWTYRIDGQYVGQGIGSVTLTPPTTVDWRFGAWEDMGE